MATARIDTHPEYGSVIVLESGDINVSIAPERGSNLFSLTYKGTELMHVHPDRPLGPDFTGDFCIYPIPNRVRNSAFDFEGTHCSFEGLLPPRGNDVLIHGLVRALAWEFDEPTVEGDDATVVTRITWDATRPEFRRFPFENVLEHRFIVSPGGVTIEYTARNTGSNRMPYGYALHPSFNRLSPDTRVSVPARSVLDMDSELLPTGSKQSVSGIDGLDLNTPQLLSGLDLDHVYTDLTGFPSIEYPDLRLSIEASDDFKFVVIHTRDSETVEIEPQTCATDAFNAPDPAAAGLLVLEPGSSRSGTISYRLHR